MANKTLTPNMGLILPVPGQDPGPDWANNQYSSGIIIDQHNHSPGQGVQITPAGININADLAINQNNLTLIRSVRYLAQSAPLSGASDIGCSYFSGVDFYVNDLNGNQVKITSGGSVNATSSGISSGTASASFVAGVLVVNAASLTPANIQGASLLLGNNVANSHYLTLSPPSAMASDYSITLPSLPVSQSFMTIDNSGIMAAPVVYPIPSSGIANQAVTTTQIANQTIQNNNMQNRALQISSSSGSFSTSSGSYVQITNFSLSITTSGNPVMIKIIPDGSSGAGGSSASIGANSPSGVVSQTVVFVQRGGTTIAAFNISTLNSNFFPPGVIEYYDPVAAGTYTYTIGMALVSGSACGCLNSKMIVREEY